MVERGRPGLAGRDPRAVPARARARGPLARGRARRHAPARARRPDGHGLRGRGLARVRNADGDAALPRSRRRVAGGADRGRCRRARSVTAKRVWIVLPDLLSIRVFFDTGILEGLRDRLGGELTAIFLVPSGDARAWAVRLDGVPWLDGATLA